MVVSSPMHKLSLDYLILNNYSQFHFLDPSLTMPYDETNHVAGSQLKNESQTSFGNQECLIL